MARQKTQLIMAGFIIFIMISSIAGFVLNFSGSSSGLFGGGSIYYNGHNFEQLQSGFTTEIDGVEIRTNVFPTDVEFISVDPEIIDLINNNPMVQLTSNFSSNSSEFIAYSAFELGNALKSKNIYAPTGFIGETHLDTDVITCDDATEFVPVIYFKESDTVKISLNNSCIIVESNDDIGFIRLKDRLIFGIYGII